MKRGPGYVLYVSALHLPRPSFNSNLNNVENWPFCSMNWIYLGNIHEGCSKKRWRVCLWHNHLRLWAFVVYFDQLSGAARTRKLVETLLFSRFLWKCFEDVSTSFCMRAAPKSWSKYTTSIGAWQRGVRKIYNLLDAIYEFTLTLLLSKTYSKFWLHHSFMAKFYKIFEIK